MDIINERKEKAQDKQRRKNERELNDIRKVLSSPEGRRWVWAIMAESGVYNDGMTGDNWTFFYSGKRSIGLGILSDILEANPAFYIQMQQENKALHQQEKIEEEKIKEQETI